MAFLIPDHDACLQVLYLLATYEVQTRILVSEELSMLVIQTVLGNVARAAL